MSPSEPWGPLKETSLPLLDWSGTAAILPNVSVIGSCGFECRVQLSMAGPPQGSRLGGVSNGPADTSSRAAVRVLYCHQK